VWASTCFWSAWSSRTDLFASRSGSAAAVSVSGMLAPLRVGHGSAIWLIKMPASSGEGDAVLKPSSFSARPCRSPPFPCLPHHLRTRPHRHSAGHARAAAGAIDDMQRVRARRRARSFGGGALMAVKAIAGGTRLRRVRAHNRTPAPRASWHRGRTAGKVTTTIFAVTLMCFTLSALDHRRDRHSRCLRRVSPRRSDAARSVRAGIDPTT